MPRAKLVLEALLPMFQIRLAATVVLPVWVESWMPCAVPLVVTSRTMLPRIVFVPFPLK